MAFCNKCGANLEPGTRFCNKCGTAVLASTLPPTGPSATARSVPPAPAPVPAPPSEGGGALKVVLIVVGVVVLIGILGGASIGLFASRVGRSSPGRQEGARGKVE